MSVTTGSEHATGARMRLRQRVWRGEEELFNALVTVASLTESG